MNIWVIDSEVMSPSVYMRRSLSNKDIFHFWDCSTGIWMKMNKGQLG